jgi:hypothetical protein
MVGMKPLERSLEKLDDVRKKKLSDMIGSSSTVVIAASSSGTGPSSVSFPNGSGGSSSHEVICILILHFKNDVFSLQRCPKFQEFGILAIAGVPLPFFIF